ncbi:hypothetical protein GP486_003813 [Trichoglossum hirsutum]|uniref:Uncharacterized protein n=1 Tax=Trichoglossum hirsutum TaxID=265104 RepID=A0A9P8LCC6_9PEZI|nr:hypothetical protein GP486_003813 [Trichoglossum hirsutum]
MSIQQELFEGESIEESAAAKEIGEELAELQRMNKEKLDDVKHVAQRQLTVADLNKYYSLRLIKREHEEVEDELRKEQDELKKEGEERIKEQDKLIEEYKRNNESQKRGFQMKIDELNEQLRVMKASI